MFINTYCRHCGTQVFYEDSRDFIYCWSCGEKIFKYELDLAAAQQQAPSANAAPFQNVPYPNPVLDEGPNVIVTYTTAHPEFPMFFRIRSTNEKFLIPANSSMSFNMGLGRQTLYFGFNGRYYARNIMVLGAPPIRIECCWDSRVRINILMPSSVYNPPGY